MLNIGRGIFSLIPKKEPVEKKPEPENNDRGLLPSISKNAQEAAQKTGSIKKAKPVPGEAVFNIEVEQIKPNPFQPRKFFDELQLADLAASIREMGILQPLVVTKTVRDTNEGTAVEYQLVAGERRLQAAKLAGLERVPVIIRNFVDKREKLEVALIENLQRENLNPLEEARAYGRLQDEFGLTQREIAARVAKSREVVANRLRLLNLPSGIQAALADGRISESQARTLLASANPAEQAAAFTALMGEKLSVRSLEEKIRKPKLIDPQMQYWAEKIEESLGVPVKISKKGEKGKLVVQFYSDEEWRGIIQKLLGEDGNKDF